MFKLCRVFLLSIMLAMPQGITGAQEPPLAGAVLRVGQGALNGAVCGSVNGGDPLSNLKGARMRRSPGGGGDLLGGLLGGGGDGGGGGLLGGLLGGGGGGGLLGGLLGGGGGGGGLLGGLLGGSGGRRAGGGGAPEGYETPQLDGGVLAEGGLLGNLFGGNGGGGVLGILGNGGLLGTVQGLLGLRIIDLTLPIIKLKLLPGIGVFLNVYTRVAINGKSLLGFLDIDVEVNITAKTRLTQESSGVPRLIIEDCDMLLGGIHIGLLKGLLTPILDGLLNNVLRNVLPGALCPVLDVVLDVVNGLLVTANSLVPLGLVGSIQYTVSSLPIVSGQFIELDLNTIVSGVGGGLIDYPLANRKPIKMPPMKDATKSQLGLSSDFLGCVLTALQKEGLLDVEINDGDLEGLPPLTTSSLGAVIPKVTEKYRDSRPLVIKMTVSKPPKVTLEKDRGVVTIKASAEIFASMPDASRRSICALDVEARLAAQFSIVDGDKLKIDLSLDSDTITLKSSAVGPFDVAPIDGLIGIIFNVAFLPTLNNVIGKGISLPMLMKIDFTNGDIDILDDLIVLKS